MNERTIMSKSSRQHQQQKTQAAAALMLRAKVLHRSDIMLATRKIVINGLPTIERDCWMGWWTGFARTANCNCRLVVSYRQQDYFSNHFKILQQCTCNWLILLSILDWRVPIQQIQSTSADGMLL
jgi:hypothetical protein